MKKTILFLSIVFIVFACSKEVSVVNVENVVNVKQNDRLSFKNAKEFFDTYKKLSNFSSKDELQFWAQNQNHTTLLYSNDSTIENYSVALKTILNKDSEYELGDDIVWFNNGKLYSFSKSEESIINTLKMTPNKCNVIGSIVLQEMGTNNLKSTSLSTNGLSAIYQKEFYQWYYQPCGGTLAAVFGLRKHVYEIYAECIHMGSGYLSYYAGYTHLRVKLEWKGSQDWQHAGEQREISINVSGSANAVESNGGNGESAVIPFSFPNQTYDCSGDIDLLLANFESLMPSYWTVSMTGEIYQKVKGDFTYNGWGVSGELW
jgi:hypothetical protein